MDDELQRVDRLKGFDDFVSSLGDELRGERATIGKSLLDVQRDLRIRAAYIAAIEGADPSVFPNQGFIAGYVRSYARYLKLDPDEIFKRFCDESGYKGVSAELSPQKSKRSSTRPEGGANRATDMSLNFANAIPSSNENFLTLMSPSGIASVAVLFALVAGLGFGGWTILNEIQRVEFTPTEQTPGADTASINFDAPEIATDPEVVDVAESVSDTRSADLVRRLYRPQELSIPQLKPREGPIASIDPDSIGIVRTEKPKLELKTVSASSKVLQDNFVAPVVTVAETVHEVQLVATRAAWVRVHLSDGTVLFEKILEKGERYSVPADADNPLLRAGNSGSVYVVVNNEVFGPVGNGTSVAKEVSLASADIKSSFEVAIDLPDDLTTSTAGVNTAENQ